MKKQKQKEEKEKKGAGNPTGPGPSPKIKANLTSPGYTARSLCAANGRCIGFGDPIVRPCISFF
jgi:hypothetical protein